MSRLPPNVQALTQRVPAAGTTPSSTRAGCRLVSHQTRRPSGPWLLGSALPSRTNVSRTRHRDFSDVHSPPRTNFPPRRPSRRMPRQRALAPRARSHHAQPRLQPPTALLPMHRVSRLPTIAECITARGRIELPTRPHRCSGRCGKCRAPRWAMGHACLPGRTARPEHIPPTTSLDSSSHTDRTPTYSHDCIAHSRRPEERRRWL